MKLRILLLVNFCFSIHCMLEHEIFEQSLIQAQQALGECYLFGKGGQTEYEKARIILEKVSNQNDDLIAKAWSLAYLSHIYLFGLGVEHDFFKSRILLNSALKFTCHNKGEFDELLEYSDILFLFCLYDDRPLAEQIEKQKEGRANQRDIFGRSRLYKAIKSDFQHVIDLLLFLQPDLHLANEDNRSETSDPTNAKTPFEAALEAVNQNIVHQIVERGMADDKLEDLEFLWRASKFDKHKQLMPLTKKKKKNEEHALHWACLYGDLPMIESLITQSSDIFKAGYKKADTYYEYEMPLECALLSGNEKAVSLIIIKALKLHHENYAHPDDQSDNASVASMVKVPACRDHLKKIHNKDSKGKRPIHYAARAGNERIVDTLLNLGARVTQSVITEACRSGNFQLVAKLEEHYGRPKTRSLLKPVKKDTTLHEAAASGSQELIASIIEKKKELINMKDGQECTPLYYAVKNGHEEAIRLLVKNGADLTMLQGINEPRSLIEIAVAANNMPVVRLLFSLGEKLPAVTKIEIAHDRLGQAMSGLLSAVRDYSYQEALMYIFSHLRDENRSEAAQAVHDIVLRWLLSSPSKRFSDFMFKHYALEETRAPLKKEWFNCAIHLGNSEIVETMLRRGDVAVNEPNYSGMLPLTLAALTCNYPMVELLLAFGADVNQPCLLDEIRGAITPLIGTLMRLCDRELGMINHNETLAITKLLIAKGANVNYDCNGITALHCAAQAGSAEIVKLLLDHNADHRIKDDRLKTAVDEAASDDVRALLLKAAERVLPPNPLISLMKKHGASEEMLSTWHERFPLHFAVENGLLEAASLLLEQGEDINCLIPHNLHTPLHRAVIKGQIESIKFLLAKGAKIHYLDREKKTAFCYALESGNGIVAKLLLEHIPHAKDLDAADESPYIGLACYMKLGFLIPEMVGKGFDKNKPYWGRRPLHLSTIGDTAALLFLLSSGVNVNERCTDQRTALMEAALNKNYDAAKILLEHQADVNAVDKYGNSALHKAVTSGEEKIVELLLDKGASLSARNREYKESATPLDLALNRLSKKEVVELLLKRKAPLNGTVNSEGMPPLFIAIDKGNMEYVDLLIKAGADSLWHQEKTGDTALHFALRKKQLPIARYLIIERHCDLKALNSAGQTVLHLAASAQNKEIIERLLDSGANINAIDELGWPPLFFACTSSNAEVTKLLLSKGADATMKQLRTKSGCSSSNHNMNVGTTALHLAAACGNEEMCLAVLMSGCPLDSQNEYKETPLGSAVTGRKRDNVKVLLEKGANPNSVTFGGSSIIFDALKDTTILELLLLNGSNPNAVDKELETPLHTAVRYGRTDAIKLLLKHGADKTKKNIKGKLPIELTDNKEIQLLILANR